MTRLLTTRTFRLPFLGDFAIETYSVQPESPWFETWTEGRSRLFWCGRNLVILN